MDQYSIYYCCRNILASKRRCRSKAGRRAARRKASGNRDRACRSTKGKNGVGQAADVLSVYQEMGGDIIDLKNKLVTAASLISRSDVWCTSRVNLEEKQEEIRTKIKLN